MKALKKLSSASSGAATSSGLGEDNNDFLSVITNARSNLVVPKHQVWSHDVRDD
jgi:hypothetical protein